jgi:hypothetical protein
MQPFWARHKAAGEQVKAKSMHDVREVVLSTGYDAALLTLVQGLVEDTIPARAPSASRCCGSTPTGTGRPGTS